LCVNSTGLGSWLVANLVLHDPATTDPEALLDCYCDGETKQPKLEAGSNGWAARRNVNCSPAGASALSSAGIFHALAKCGARIINTGIRSSATMSSAKQPAQHFDE